MDAKTPAYCFRGKEVTREVWMAAYADYKRAGEAGDVKYQIKWESEWSVFPRHEDGSIKTRAYWVDGVEVSLEKFRAFHAKLARAKEEGDEEFYQKWRAKWSFWGWS